MDDALRIYLDVLRGYVELTRKYFETNVPLSFQPNAYLQMVLGTVDQARDAYVEALTEADLPVPGSDEVPPSLNMRDPATQAEIRRISTESEDAHNALVTSILTDDEDFLDRSIDSLLGDGIVTIVKPQGVVWATVIDAGTDDAGIRGEFRTFNGGSGNSVVALSSIPASHLKPTLRRHLAVWIANVVGSDQSAWGATPKRDRQLPR